MFEVPGGQKKQRVKKDGWLIARWDNDGLRGTKTGEEKKLGIVIRCMLLYYNILLL